MAIFGKKGEGKGGPKSDVPVQAVISMKQRGLTNEQVIEQLKSQGYSLQSIKDALTQANVKQSAISPAPPPGGAASKPQPSGPGPALPPLPGGPAPAPGAGAAPQQAPATPPPPQQAKSPARGAPELAPASFGPPTTQQAGGVKVEEMERILEEIVDERWKDVTSKFSELETAKAKNETRIEELGNRVNALSSRLDEISTVIMSRVDEYKKTMEDVDVEIKALEKVMQKLVPSMAEQVKELKGVIGGLKTKPLE